MIAAWLIFACIGPDEGARQTSTWTVLANNVDLGLLDVRLSQGNTGMLAGQGTVRAAWLPLKDGALHYTRRALPGDTREDETGVWVGPDSLHQEGTDWELSIQSGMMDARVQFKNQLESLPPSTAPGWTVQPIFAGRMSGVLRSGTQSAILDGSAVGIHRFGSNPPGLRGTSRRSAYVLDDDLAIGIDQSGAQALAFAVVGGTTLDPSTAVLTKTPDGVYMDFRPAVDLEVIFSPRKPHLQTDPWDHLLGVERWIAGLRFGRPVRRVRAASAQIRMGDRQLRARGLISVSDFK